MQAFHPDVWAVLVQLVETDDGSGVAAWADSQADAPAAVLGWHHPDDEERRTLLMLAYWWGKASAAKALVNAGSNYQQADAKGRDAAWYARRYGKGARELELSNAIRASVRRISMQSVIEGAAKPSNPPPKRRSSDV